MIDFHSIEKPARRLLALLSLVILLAVIALHFGLVDLGQWALDEFSVIALYRDYGWTGFVHRLIGWSPRPISELLIWCYAYLVNWTHKPLIGLFLGSVWLTLISAPLISFLQIRKTSLKNSQGSLFLSLFAFTTIALFLLGHSPGQLFYWPMGAAAYLTTLSATTLCFLQLAFSLTENFLGRVITSFSLIIAAGSSETGAFFVIVFSCLSLAQMAVHAIRDTCRRQKVLWFLIPSLVGIGVFLLLLQNRVQNQDPLFRNPEYHHLLLSLKAAVGQTFKECLVTGQRLSTRSILLGLLLKGCFLLALRYCWLSSGMKVPRRQPMVVLAIALAATIYFSVAACYYGFGGPSNDRHHELRQCLIILFIATAATLSCSFHRTVCNLSKLEWLAAAFVFVTIVLAVPPRISALKHDYENYPVCIESRRRSWNSGLLNGDAMIWFSPPQGRVANTYINRPGTYNVKSKSPDFAVTVMQFFKKKSLEIRPYIASAK
ncbi:MAG: hypothetical protein JO279_01600 [Verrucomicrobia bacterium]|nr:hypothetical protein [Verrucomicrobiota bacterium]